MSRMYFIVKIKYHIFLFKKIKLYRSCSCVQNFLFIHGEQPTQVEIICTLVYLISSLYYFVSFVMQFLNSIKSFYIYSLFKSVESIELKYIKKPKRTLDLTFVPNMISKFLYDATCKQKFSRLSDVSDLKKTIILFSSLNLLA